MKSLFLLALLTVNLAISARATVQGDIFEIQYFFPDTVPYSVAILPSQFPGRGILILLKT